MRAPIVTRPISQIIPPAPALSLGIVTHYTSEPWHKDRMDVVQLCLTSMLTTRLPKYELLIWDNGSTPAFREMLRSFHPAVFVESENIGPQNGRRGLAQIARAPVISLTDDDILFSCDWFMRQLEILEGYPKVGLVSGCPHHVAFDIRKAQQSVLGWALNDQDCTVWQDTILTPEQWENDYLISVGRRPHDYRGDVSFDDALLEYHGLKAWGNGHHMQFLAYTETARKFLLPFNHTLAYDNLNSRVSDMKYLQLTTYDRTVAHIGNVIDETIERAKIHMRSSHPAPVFKLPKPIK